MLRRILALVFLAALSCAAEEPFATYYRRQADLASKHHHAKEYAKTIAILDELLRRPELKAMDMDYANVRYNLACAYSLGGQKDKALATLKDAAAAETLSSASLKSDTDFDPIRNDPEFQGLLARIQERERPQELLWNNPVWKTPYREDLPVEEKVAGLSKLWSEAKYNFVFFYRMKDLDWDRLYLAYLPKVMATKSTLEYYYALAEFCAKLGDGHSGVNYPRELNRLLGWPAITTRLLEKRVFVDAVRDPALKDRGVERGMEITAIDGLPVRDYGMKHVAPTRAVSTPQDLEVRTFENALLGGVIEKPVALTLRSADAREVTVSLPRLSQAEANKLPRQEWKRFEYRLLPGNIAYVALRTFGTNEINRDWEAVYPEIRKSDALILDVRDNGGGSSGIGWEILGYLTDKPFKSTQWRTRLYRPAFRAWGNAEQWFEGGSNSLYARSGDVYTKPVVVLIGPHTYSAAEDFAAVFDAMNRGRLVGEPTGGSTGQPLGFSLPGGGSARICTKHDRYADGKEFVGVGIQPGVPVQPTIADFRAGRDTVLDAAVRELGKNR